MLLSLVFAAATLFVEPAQAAPAPQTAAPATAPATPGEPDPNRQICRREHVVGSNRPQRTCMTARQWAVLRDASREQTERMTRERPNEGMTGRQ